jgi:hypothetical protein
LIATPAGWVANREISLTDVIDHLRRMQRGRAELLLLPAGARCSSKSFAANFASERSVPTCGLKQVLMVAAKDGTALLDELFADAAFQQRINMIATAPNSYSRVASQNFSSLADWKEVIRQSYPLREHRAELPRIELAHPDDEKPDFGEDNGSLGVRNHKGISIRSVIDVHAWNRARWQGCGYINIGHSLPYMAFLFEDKEGARKIFERWRERFGAEDASEEIGVSIIRNLPGTNLPHYCVQIASNDPLSRGAGTKAPVMVATRSMTMEPNDSRNLDMFLAGYQRHRGFYLLPAVGRINPEFFFDLTILKRDLTVKSATEVHDHDIEAMALRTRGLKTAI